MGLLNATTRRALIDLLLRIPNIESPSVRQQFISDALGEFSRYVSVTNIADHDIRVLVRFADNESYWIKDGESHTLRLCQEGIHYAPTDTTLHVELSRLYREVQGVPSVADHPVAPPKNIQRTPNKEKQAVSPVADHPVVLPVPPADRLVGTPTAATEVTPPQPPDYTKKVQTVFPSVASVPRFGALVVGVTIEWQRDQYYTNVANSAEFMHQTLGQLQMVEPQDNTLLTGAHATAEKLEAALAALEQQLFESVFVIIVGRYIVSDLKLVLYNNNEELDLNKLLQRLNRLANRGTGVCCVLDLGAETGSIQKLAHYGQQMVVFTWRAMSRSNYLAAYFHRVIQRLAQAASQRAQTSDDLYHAVERDPDQHLFFCTKPSKPILILPMQIQG